MQIVAVMVFCSTILFPLTELVALLYVLIPLRAGYVPAGFNQVLRAIQFVRPWGMIEVFMLGVLITIVKMVSLARVIPEAALFAFGALTLMFAVVVSSTRARCGTSPNESDRAAARRAPSGATTHAADSQRHADRFRHDGTSHDRTCRHRASRPRAAPDDRTYITATRAGLVACHACGRVNRRVTVDHAQHCARCGAHAAPAQSRQPDAHLGAADRRRVPVYSGESAAGDAHGVAARLGRRHDHERRRAISGPRRLAARRDRVHRQHHGADAQARACWCCSPSPRSAARAGGRGSAPRCTGWSSASAAGRCSTCSSSR